MKLRKFILLLIVACAGFLSHGTFGVDSQENSYQFEPCDAGQDFSSIHSTEINSASDSYALTTARTVNASVLRNTNGRRTVNQNNLEDKIAQTVREIAKRQFSKCTDEPSFFQKICSNSEDYLISIGILVI